MEELFAYALVLSEGYDFWDEYYEIIDRLFMKYPDNEEYLRLEEISSEKDAILHMLSMMNSAVIEKNVLGKTLMNCFKKIYNEIDLKEFSRKTYSIWNKLPSELIQEEPFWTFDYANECLTYGDEEQCRILYDRALNYYE